MSSKYLPQSKTWPQPVKTVGYTPKHEGKERTNNIAVDMCLACIIHSQKQGYPLKVIQLNAQYWGWFTAWVKTLAKPGEELPQRWLIDEVMIEAGEAGQEDILKQIFE